MRHRWFTPVGLLDPDPVFGSESLGSYLGRYSGVVPRSAEPLMGRRLGGLLDFGDFRGPQRERGAGERRTLLGRLGLVGELLGGDLADVYGLVRSGMGLIAEPQPGFADQGGGSWLGTGLAAAGLLAGPLMASGPVGRVLARKADDLPAGGAPPRRVENPIRAYHGSPHDFDQFSLEKIGTGEGAQAYGHGLYFAESPDVAGFYRSAGEPSWRNAGVRAIVDDAMQEASEKGLAGNEARKWARDRIHGMAMERDPALRGQWFDASNNLDLILDEPVGRTYEVAIHADPDEFLDWDAPLSEQAVAGLVDTPERAAARYFGYDLDEFMSFSPEQRQSYIAKAPIAASQGSRTGSWHFAQLADELGESGAAARLREAGIPGIRYYDQMSRGAGQGTRNYVVFDDSLVEILKKYGIAGVFGAGMLSRWANGDAR